MQNRNYIFISLAIIVIIYYLLTYNTSMYEEYMYGLWTADDDFCIDSKISSMLLFIGPQIRGWTSITRAGYIIICDDITNQPLSIEYRTGYGGIGVGKYTINAKFKFDIEDIFMNDGRSVKLEFDIVRGKLRIYDPKDGKVYARMYKQNDISNLLAVDSDALAAGENLGGNNDSTDLSQEESTDDNISSE